MARATDFPGLAALADAAGRQPTELPTFLGAPPALAELRARRGEIFAAAGRNRASNVRVFGSVARGEAGATSDLDLLIDLDERGSLLDIAGLVVELQDLLACPVNVTRAGGLRRPELRARILTEALPL